MEANQTIVTLSQMKDSPSTDQNARPQFSDEQQAFVVLKYEKYKASGYEIFCKFCVSMFPSFFSYPEE